MKRTARYDTHERRTIAANLGAGRAPECPRCGTRLVEWPVPPRSDVSYVRDRVWLVCGPCEHSVVPDRVGPEG